MTGSSESHVVPNSAGTGRPRLKAPANAADCHMHIYDPRFPQLASRSPVSHVILGLIDKGRTWVKLAGAYLNTQIGPPTYADATRVAQAFVKATPERLVWGSDWPHPTEKDKPDDALLFDLLAAWAPDEAVRKRILVTNPEALYGFDILEPAG